MVYVGYDVSKSKLDFSYQVGKDAPVHGVVVNSPKAIRLSLLQWKGQYDTIHLCVEDTGIYSIILLREAYKLGIKVSIVAGAEVRNSLGLRRGKTDKVDAARVAEYARRFTDRLKLWEPEEASMLELKALLRTRARLVKAVKMLSVPLAEGKKFLTPVEAKAEKEAVGPTIKALKKQIEETEKKIKALIDRHEGMKAVRDRIISIPGVGPVVSAEMIAQTACFTKFTSGKQLACHAGVVPFEHSSGSSIRGKTRVSHRANKRLKTLLHLSAMAAIRSKGELKDYYERRLELGKHKMSVLNAIRGKIVLRIFAIAKSDKKYEKNYEYPLQKP
jgi:hypothetical protein